jgi:hypothetical protein
MAARRSFLRTMGKYQPHIVVMPVALITAWRGQLLDGGGRSLPEVERRSMNDEANLRLMANILRRGLSYYAVIGAGQEYYDSRTVVNKERTVVVQAVNQIEEPSFLDEIRELLFNPTGEFGLGPHPHTQWGAIVKLPSMSQAFLLHCAGNGPPAGPHDYNYMDLIGNSAAPRLLQEPAYTQMQYRPRATAEMMDPFDLPDDVGNIAGLPGKRFTVRDVP